MPTQGQKDSRKQERRGARVYGGTVNSGSGNTSGHKNDVRTPELSIEFKCTRQKSYTLKLADLLTAANEAIRDGREALFGLDFLHQEPNGRLVNHRFVILPEWDYLDMRRRLAEAEENQAKVIDRMRDEADVKRASGHALMASALYDYAYMLERPGWLTAHGPEAED